MKRKWWQRFQIEIGVTGQLVPSGEMTWREWAFSPSGAFFYPGMVVKVPGSIPANMRGRGMLDIQGSVFKTQFYWIGGALRVLGVDFGFSVWNLPNPK